MCDHTCIHLGDNPLLKLLVYYYKHYTETKRDPGPQTPENKELFPSPPIRSGEAFSSVIFSSLSLLFVFLDVAMVWKGREACVCDHGFEREIGLMCGNNNNYYNYNYPRQHDIYLSSLGTNYNFSTAICDDHTYIHTYILTIHTDHTYILCYM